MNLTVIDIARLFRFVREAGANRGQRVEAIQRWSGGQPGESWCAYFLTLVFDLVYQGQSLVPRTGVCQDIYDLAKQHGWLVDVPRAGDLFLYVNEVDHAHHCGLVTYVLGGVGKLTQVIGIAGNTSADGTSSNGDGVYEHDISTGAHVKWVRVPSP